MADGRELPLRHGCCCQNALPSTIYHLPSAKRGASAPPRLCLGGVKALGKWREAVGGSLPLQFIHRLEHRDVDAEGRQVAEQERQLAIAFEGGCQRGRVIGIHPPLLCIRG